MRNYNTLIGRYPGADGMKTGFICASGFNLVASATRDGKRLIAVVLGAPSSAARAVKAAQLLERGFNSKGALSLADALARHGRDAAAVDAAPPNLRDEMCGRHRKRPARPRTKTSTSPPIRGRRLALRGLSLEPCVRRPTGQRSRQTPRSASRCVVYTGVKPPAPGAAQAGWSEGKPKAQEEDRHRQAMPGGKEQAKDAAPRQRPSRRLGEGAPKATAPAPGVRRPTPAAATATGEPKPKPKKPAPKPRPTRHADGSDPQTQEAARRQSRSQRPRPRQVGSRRSPSAPAQ